MKNSMVWLIFSLIFVIIGFILSYANFLLAAGIAFGSVTQWLINSYFAYKSGD